MEGIEPLVRTRAAWLERCAKLCSSMEIELEELTRLLAVGPPAEDEKPKYPR